MNLRLPLLLISIIILSAALYFSSVQSLFRWLPASIRFNSSQASGLTEDELALDLLPGPEDWVDHGPILEAGREGDWDFLFAGITPASLVKKDGVYYFYYVGADGYRSFDGGPRYRSIGVATSEDGIHYHKYTGNPIMTHLPLNGEEEGANSAGVTLDQQGDFVMYYGGAVGERDVINANGRLAVSQDGFNFTDKGIVIHRLNPFVYGFGDEIFPVAAFQHQGRWNVYYQPNGALNERTLGMVWGSRMDRLNRSTGVLDERSGGAPVVSWGNITWLAPDRIALFIQRLWWPDTFIEVRTASPDAPHRLSEPVVRYDIPNLKHGTIFLDTDRRTWFMIYNDFDNFWRLRLAPAGEADHTPPTPPVGIQAQALAYDRVRLTWEPASDPDTGVVSYRIYRDGIEVGSTMDWSFTETGLSELSPYTYEISAVNFHGYEGPREVVSTVTPGDQTAPRLENASTQGNAAQLMVVFSEPVDRTSAEDPENYRINPTVEVTQANLQADMKSVSLSTSPHQEGVIYTLEVENILDRAASPNEIERENEIHYTHSSIAGRVGYWSFDEEQGRSAGDYSGYGNHAVVEGAGWQAGHKGAALSFDGMADYVMIEDETPLTHLTESSFTFSAWVNPADLPEPYKPYAILLRVNSHPAYSFGLTYTASGRFQAQVITGDEEFHVLTSSPFEPGTWRHLAMVVDVDFNQLHLYLDGEPVNDSPLVFSGELMDLSKSVGENYPTGEYYIGSTKPDLGAGSFFTQHYKGLIDEVSVYSRALDAEEITYLAAHP
jgi:hypothetical protein